MEKLIHLITEPVLVVDLGKVKRNLSRMVDKCSLSGTLLRPHMKTHQSKLIGELIRSFGVKHITVSSVKMAEYFAGQWEDITIAFPFNVLQINRINNILERQPLLLLVDALSTLLALQNQLNQTVGIWIDIDTGYGRTGIKPSDVKLIDQLIIQINASEKTYFKGFYCHAGDTYHAESPSDVIRIFERSLFQLMELKRKYSKEDFIPEVNYGDTPSCSLSESFQGLDSVSPGNFIFYDLTQQKLGSCKEEDIAVSMACPIISINKERMQVIVYGGGVHFSKDRLPGEFGKLVTWKKDHWVSSESENKLMSVSQEHGIIKADQSLLESVAIGDILFILPVHSCMTAACMKGYMDTSGNFVDHMEGFTRN